MAIACFIHNSFLGYKAAFSSLFPLTLTEEQDNKNPCSGGWKGYLSPFAFAIFPFLSTIMEFFPKASIHATDTESEK
jgi:hypothetical protein